MGPIMTIQQLGFALYLNIHSFMLTMTTVSRVSKQHQRLHFTVFFFSYID